MTDNSTQKTNKKIIENKERDIRLFGLDKKMNDDENYVFDAVIWYPNLIVEASERLKTNKEFLIKVARKNSLVYKFISKSIRNDVPFILEVAKENAEIIRQIPCESGLFDHQVFHLKAIELNEEVFSHMSSGDYSLKNNPKYNFVFDAARTNGWVLKYVEKSKTTDELLSTALIQIFSTKDFILSDNAIAKFNEINSKKKVFTKQQWQAFLNNDKLLSQLNKNLYNTFINSTQKFDGNVGDFTTFASQLNLGIKRMLKDFKSEQENFKKPLIKKMFDRLKEKEF